MTRIACLAMVLILAVPAGAYDARLLLPSESAQGPEMPAALNLQSQGDAQESSPIRPAVVGLMSAVVPGAGQLKMGQQRGWIYLGLEVATWFAYFALDDSGNQGVEDYQRFAQAHWDTTRYIETASCGDFGPIDFDNEKDALWDLYENDRDLWYAEIGDRGVYACGWETLGHRNAYNRRREHASDLSNMASNMVYVMMLNRLVSVIDAARSAAALNSRHWDLRMRFDRSGGPEVTMAFHQPLR